MIETSPRENELIAAWALLFENELPHLISLDRSNVVEALALRRPQGDFDLRYHSRILIYNYAP